jgi:hypothetical protein
VGAVPLTRIGNDAAILVPQLFKAETVIFPFCPNDPIVTEIPVDPCPELIIHPDGTLQE